jgi:transglutaminase-like putative cysteine protease
MRASPFFILVLAGLTLAAREEPTRTFRRWLGGQEVGGTTEETRQDGKGREIRSRDWIVLSRLGQEIRQEVAQTARKSPDGSLTFTWRVQLSSEPFEGRGEWSPREPGILALHPTHGPSVRKDLPQGAILWPEDLETRLKEAARNRHPIHAVTFSFPFQQWNTLDLTPQGPAPLPGFPDAIRFTGQEQEGPITAPVELWLSPIAGELRQRSQLGGLELLQQRSDLPPPSPSAGTMDGFFERTLKKLPPQPFQPWLPGLVMRVEGQLPPLPEDAQQVRLPNGRWQLRRAVAPTPLEAAQPPVMGVAPPDLARYLAASPLVQFQDPAFDGLLRRLALPPGLSRWALAQRVTGFVFDWIIEKDYTVGFASALEVVHHPRGDCTEHGVLAVALLRRLGVPARGVTGWVGLGELLGLHFWVEVRLLDRWVPIDPTFDQAPASALRIKVSDTDLADMGSVLWEGSASDLSRVQWIPEGEPVPSIQGDQVTSPGGIHLRLPGGRWDFRQGVLRLWGSQGGPWRVQATIRPSEAQLKGATRLAGARTSRKGWWQPASRQLWMDLGGRRWLQVEGLSEAEAFDLLDQLMAPASSS